MYKKFRRLDDNQTRKKIEIFFTIRQSTFVGLSYKTWCLKKINNIFFNYFGIIFSYLTWQLCSSLQYKNVSCNAEQTIICQQSSKQLTGACPNIRFNISLFFCVLQAMNFYPSANTIHFGHVSPEILLVLSSVLGKTNRNIIWQLSH